MMHISGGGGGRLGLELLRNIIKVPDTMAVCASKEFSFKYLSVIMNQIEYLLQGLFISVESGKFIKFNVALMMKKADDVYV